MTVGLAITIILEVFYGGFGWHRTEVIAKYGDDVITVYHIVSFSGFVVNLWASMELIS